MKKVLVLTALFPNKIKPDLGIFIKKRMFAYAKRKGCKIGSPLFFLVGYAGPNGGPLERHMF